MSDRVRWVQVCYPQPEVVLEEVVKCARCDATLRAKVVDGVDTVCIEADVQGWLGLTSGWYCPCCRSLDCPH
jgi:hypothetical protein